MFRWWRMLYPAIVLHLNVSPHSGGLELKNRTEQRRSLSRLTLPSPPLTHIIFCILAGVFRFFFRAHIFLKSSRLKHQEITPNKNRRALNASQHFNWRSRHSESGVAGPPCQSQAVKLVPASTPLTKTIKKINSVTMSDTGCKPRMCHITLFPCSLPCSTPVSNQTNTK
jgi:hypothetical protein